MRPLIKQKQASSPWFVVKPFLNTFFLLMLAQLFVSTSQLIIFRQNGFFSQVYSTRGLIHHILGFAQSYPVFVNHISAKLYLHMLIVNAESAQSNFMQSFFQTVSKELLLDYQFFFGKVNFPIPCPCGVCGLHFMQNLFLKALPIQLFMFLIFTAFVLS